MNVTRLFLNGQMTLQLFHFSPQIYSELGSVGFMFPDQPLCFFVA